MYIMHVVHLWTELWAHAGAWEYEHPQACSRIPTCSGRSPVCLILCKSTWSDLSAWRMVPEWSTPLHFRAVSLIRLSNKSFHLKPQAHVGTSSSFPWNTPPRGQILFNYVLWHRCCPFMTFISLSSCHFMTLSFLDIKQVVSYILWVSSMGWDS